MTAVRLYLLQELVLLLLLCHVALALDDFVVIVLGVFECSFRTADARVDVVALGAGRGLLLGQPLVDLGGIFGVVDLVFAHGGGMREDDVAAGDGNGAGTDVLDDEASEIVGLHG